ncbi:MAG TPA: hypothetical protein VKK79_03255 [Candidatus Lokiarchaeia archaeon]|nr:hypothetical protein [Candidatus Lokiarchaeia archaeon]
MKKSTFSVILTLSTCVIIFVPAYTTAISNVVATFNIQGQQKIIVAIDGSIKDAIYANLDKFTLQFQDGTGQQVGITTMQGTFDNESLLLAFDFSDFPPVASGAPFCMRIFFDDNDSKTLDVGERAVEINWTDPHCVALDAHIANASMDLQYNLENDLTAAYSKSGDSLELLMKVNVTREVGGLSVDVGGEIPFLITLQVESTNPSTYYYPSNNGDLAAFKFLNITGSDDANAGGFNFFNSIPGPALYFVGCVTGLAVLSISHKIRRDSPGE